MDNILQAIKDFILTLKMTKEIMDVYNNFPVIKELALIASAIGIIGFLKKKSRRSRH